MGNVDGGIGSLKALLVLHAMEQRVGPTVFRRTLQAAVITARHRSDTPFPQHQLSTMQNAASHEPAVVGPLVVPSGLISIGSLLDGLMYTAGDIGAGGRAGDAGFHSPTSTSVVGEHFLKQWVFGSGLPRFTGIVEYNRSLNRVEIELEQHVVANAEYAPFDWEKREAINPLNGVKSVSWYSHARSQTLSEFSLPNKYTNAFSGYITIRIVERDATHEYRKSVNPNAPPGEGGAGDKIFWTFPCHKKIKKRAGGLRKVGPSAHKSLILNDTPVEYVVLDPQMAWLKVLDWHMPFFMWHSQLNSKFITEQCQALAALAIPAKACAGSITGPDTSVSRFCPAVVSLKSTAVSSAPEWNGADHDVKDCPLCDKRRQLQLRACVAVNKFLADWNRPWQVRARAALELARWQQNANPDPSSLGRSTGAALHPRPAGALRGFDFLCARFRKWHCNYAGTKRSLDGREKMSHAATNGGYKAQNSGDSSYSLVSDVFDTGFYEMKKTLTRSISMVLVHCSEDHALVNAVEKLLTEYISCARRDGRACEEARFVEVFCEAVALVGIFSRPRAPQVGGLLCWLREGMMKHGVGVGVHSGGNAISAGCIYALSTLESGGQSPHPASFHEFLCPSNSSKWCRRWGLQARASCVFVMASFLNCNRFRNIERQSSTVNADWARLFAWILSIAACDPDSSVRVLALRALLGVQRDFIATRPKAGAGRLVRLCVARLWRILQRFSSNDGRLRVAAFQLYRSCWGLHDPPVVSDFVDSKPHAWLHWASACAGSNVPTTQSAIISSVTKITLRHNYPGTTEGI